MFYYAKDAWVTMSVVASTPVLHELFHLPLSIEAYDQFLAFSALIQGLQLQLDPNIWTYAWGGNAFASSKAYRSLIGHRQVPAPFRWLWCSACQNKHKFFFWLLLKDRLVTRALLWHRHMHLENYNCVLCHLNVEEEMVHLLFHCPFATAC